MARLKKHSSGNFRKTFMYNGKRYYVYGKSASELAEKENEKRLALEQGLQALYNPTLDQYYDHFTDVRRHEVRESTLRAQKSQYKNISGVEMAKGVKFGEMRIKDITRRDIEKARETLLKGGKTPENLNICFQHLNHVMHTATIDDTLTKNPCEALKKLKREKDPVKDTKHRALTEDETKRFFEAAADRKSYYLNTFKMLLSTGMRVGEVTALYPTDIDRINGFIHVRKTVTRDEVGGYYIGENPKTNSGVRDIPLTKDMISIIRDQQEQNRMIFGLDKSNIIFKSCDGHILREYTLNREIKRICEATGIEVFTCHAFRNTFATRFIEQRPHDYKILSELLGHKDISITLNIYTHVMTENKVKAMNEIELKIV